MVAEHREVFLLPLERRLEKPTDVHAAELTLLLGRDQRIEREPPAATRAVVLVAPDGVPLAMVCAIDVHRRFEPRTAVRELDALILSQAGEGGHVTVVRTVEHQIVHVLHRGRLAGWLVLPIYRSDRDDRLDVEVVV